MKNLIHDPNLVLYLPLWKLDGGSFTDKSAYGHTCTVTGAVWGVQGRTFDRDDDRILIPNHASLNMGTSDFNLFIWVKFTAIDATNQYVFYKEADYSLRVANDVMTFTIAGVAAATADTTSLSPGVFYLLGVTYDQTNDLVSYYINGVLSSQPAFATEGSGASILSLGIAPDLTQELGGVAGDIFIYKGRVLTPQEVQRLYIKTKRRYL